jgi:isopenicillin-N epimerase
MNELASWFPLQPGDEVLLNDHEYGAVHRIWQRRCEQTGANFVVQRLPLPLNNQQQIVDTILAGCNERTRLVVFSHITSPTAIRLPVQQICSALQERGIASCVDGPHAVFQEEFKLYRMGCDFYTASCHKWLCAPPGSGFIYVDPKWHEHCHPSRLSWGRLPPEIPKTWSDELIWTGTKDYSAYLSVNAAIQYLSKFDWEKLDHRNHELACYARRRLCDCGLDAITPEGREWFGWMVSLALPSDCKYPETLQKRLWEKYHVEVPIYRFGDRFILRVSCHLYNSTHDVDRLTSSLRMEFSTR